MHKGQERRQSARRRYETRIARRIVEGMSHFAVGSRIINRFGD